MTGKTGYLICLAGVLSLSMAQASTISYKLTLDGCSGGCGTSSTTSFGTVTLDDGTVSGTTIVTLTLEPGERFAGTGAGVSLEFNLKNPSAAITLDNPTDYAVGHADTASTFGAFTNSVYCKNPSACHGGQQQNVAGPLVFSVAGVKINDFIANAGGYLFSSDIVGTTGKTGNVGAEGPGVTTSAPPPSVPEPTTILLSLGGFGLIGLARARKFPSV